MKRYKLIIASIVVLLSSCTKDLVSINYSEINPAIFPKTAADLDAMVNAAYYPLRGSYSNGIFSTSEKGVMFLSDATTETLYGPYGDQNTATLQSYLPKDAAFTHYYDDYYNKISMMTNTINLIQKSTVSDDLKKKAIAEVRCARGLLAYTLFDLYGPLVIAPLSVLQNPLKEVTLARLSNQEMVDYIKADLVAAAADLPAPAEAEYGRFNKALAKMIQIRLDLHEKNWAEVLTLCNDIIGYGYYTIDPNYVGMWDLEGAKNSREVIWAIPCDYAGTSENQWQLMVLPAVFAPKGGFGTIQSTWYFYDSFESNDKRKTMLITEFTGTDGITYNRANPGTLINYGPIPLKINQDAARTTGLTTVDIIMYRYADVLLSKAEAIANISGPNQEAMDLVTTIRARAGLAAKPLASYSSLSQFNDLILLERSHEFWCENGQYRADLIRMGKFVSRCQEVKHSTLTNQYKVLYPFSPDRVAEGKGKFIQNPGYN
ncbi:RagB/SusD family nutrient uptake outer membrane protein [Mucilaginibacter sp. UR6-11]|uniref:RagB/SusD family nutrient uptake outer membrane protein n=1 Tax=Mucilaginibacter sp. UR6-11 TaxID=1435644 RepID=UPI001E652BB0|nr:RagB/SusD family nutrient uptake outer membrane protein [Mucilaginibacter sp. UR6-11]MCC8423679.1 RagB/SusD family nutrient uptake outer membrane protein [Mucilaginibacter sp. UR6-11]